MKEREKRENIEDHLERVKTTVIKGVGLEGEMIIELLLWEWVPSRHAIPFLKE